MRPDTNQNQDTTMLKQCIRLLKGQALWITGAASAAGLILISCGTGSQTLLAPPGIPGATFVGSEACEQCHDKITKGFATADHAKLKAKGENAKNIGCESCHGPGSKHVESGGANHTIVNPKQSPQACFACHLEVQAKFQLPNTHPVLRGKMSCVNCHNPHKDSAVRGGGTQLAKKNDLCFQCHTQKRGPFVYPHEAVREGCTSCHQPHGSINAKMLTERNQTLCLKCHFEQQGLITGANATHIYIGNRDHTSFVSEGACWSAGCHQAIHGSHVNKHLRY